MSEQKKDQQMSAVEQKRLGLRQFFEKQKPELSKLLPKSMSMDRFFRLALTECVKQPALLECSAESWALAMQRCAASGLYPDGELGFMYLIASNNNKKVGNEWRKVMEVRAQRGYQGDIQLARNSGEVLDMWAEVVYEKDTYVIRKGLNPTLEHTPFEPKGDDDTPGALRATYAVAKLTNGETRWVSLWRFDVMRHKASSQSTGENSPWVKHEAAMWKKSAIKELSKWLPKSTEKMQDAAKEDDEIDRAGAIQIETLTIPAPTDPPKGPVDALKDKLRGERKESESAGVPLSDGVGEADGPEPSGPDAAPPTDGPEFEKEVAEQAAMFEGGGAGEPERCLCEKPAGQPGETCENCTLPIKAKAAAPKAGGKPRMVKG